MSYKTLYACIACTLVSVCANADEITRPHLMAAAKLGNVRLFHQDNNFVVERDGEQKDIQPCFVSTDIRNISPEFLSKFIAADNYLKLSELKRTDDSVDYKLDACNRLRGGGPWLGGLTFIGGSLATIGAATGALVTGGPAGPALAVAAIYGGMAATAKATMVVTALPTP